MDNLITFLQQRLPRPLPGKTAQVKMAPEPVSGGTARKMNAPDDAQPSSVLILLFPNNHQKWELALTLRSSNIDHGGQISFPGGRAESEEEAPQTALREAKEEIGINPDSVRIMGQLSDLYINNSDNIVSPVVGYTNTKPDFKINPLEVEEVFAIELDSLLQKRNLTVEEWKLKNYIYRVPYWDIHRVPLWGATAMILSEFLDLYREFLNEF